MLVFRKLPAKSLYLSCVRTQISCHYMALAQSGLGNQNLIFFLSLALGDPTINVLVTTFIRTLVDGKPVNKAYSI